MSSLKLAWLNLIRIFFFSVNKSGTSFTKNYFLFITLCLGSLCNMESPVLIIISRWAILSVNLKRKVHDSSWKLLVIFHVKNDSLGVLPIAAIIWMPVIDWFFKNTLCYVKTTGAMFLLTIIK